MRCGKFGSKALWQAIPSRLFSSANKLLIAPAKLRQRKRNLFSVRAANGNVSLRCRDELSFDLELPAVVGPRAKTLLLRRREWIFHGGRRCRRGRGSSCHTRT